MKSWKQSLNIRELRNREYGRGEKRNYTTATKLEHFEG
jgi:hypothetical protein